MQSNTPKNRANVKSATRTLDIIEFVVSRKSPSVAQEISDALAIPVSSLSYLLNTLVERGYLVRDGRRYSPGPGLERLQAPMPNFTVVDRVTPLVRSLRIELNETTSFFVRRGWQIESLITEVSDHALRYAVPVGQILPLHSISSGKALLASFPDEEIDTYFREAHRDAMTRNTVVSEQKLRAEIEDIRRTGIAYTREEHTLGICGMGRAIRIDGEVGGAISVAIPLVRYDDRIEEKVASLLNRTAELLNIS
ncbi:IclR family transcriptional regulator [Emcibacter sp.]|uniref:IclR family transcriptional regulator n=1 Tax=Emcibacter sp. TaxID=1979954 RepID=UPI002AA6CC52|nr:IclR family transcriptional regulator [Emcibacter sp.]